MTVLVPLEQFLPALLPYKQWTSEVANNKVGISKLLMDHIKRCPGQEIKMSS